MSSTKLTTAVKRDLAEKILYHMAFHSKYAGVPHLYQFSLPDNCWLTVEDALGPNIIGQQVRVLNCWTVTGNSGGMPISSVIRPKGSLLETPWFEQAPTPKEWEKAIKAVIVGIEYSHRNKNLNNFIRDNAMQVDLNVEPQQQPPVPFSGVKLHMKWFDTRSNL